MLRTLSLTPVVLAAVLLSACTDEAVDTGVTADAENAPPKGPPPKIATAENESPVAVVEGQSEPAEDPVGDTRAIDTDPEPPAFSAPPLSSLSPPKSEEENAPEQNDSIQIGKVEQNKIDRLSRKLLRLEKENDRLKRAQKLAEKKQKKKSKTPEGGPPDDNSDAGSSDSEGSDNDSIPEIDDPGDPVFRRERVSKRADGPTREHRDHKVWLRALPI